MCRVWSACNNEKYANMKRASEVDGKKCLFENDQYGTHTEMLPSTILAFKSASYVWAFSDLGLKQCSIYNRFVIPLGSKNNFLKKEEVPLEKCPLRDDICQIKTWSRTIVECSFGKTQVCLLAALEPTSQSVAGSLHPLLKEQWTTIFHVSYMLDITKRRKKKKSL